MTRVFLFLGLCCSLSLSAQQDQFRFARLDINRGLSHNYTSCFLKDSRGFIWIGTGSGLNRFDGYSVKIFKSDLRDTTTISNNNINTLFEDPNGRIWVSSTTGTSDVNIFDPVTELFTHKNSAYLRQYGIADGRITDIVKDSQHNFWFIHYEKGLYRYSSRTKTSEQVSYTSPDSLNSENRVVFVTEDTSGTIWIIQENGILKKINPATLKVEYSNSFLKSLYRSKESSFKMVADADGDLWIFLSNSNHGVFVFNTRSNAFQHVHEGASALKLNNNIVRGIAQDNQGFIWIATDHGGLNVVDKKKQTIRYQLHNPSDDKSLAQNSINALYKDRDGILWVGTFKEGVCYYHESLVRFPLYRHEPSNPFSLPYSDINRFVEDEKGNLWLGTNGGGLIYFNRSNNTYKQFRHDAKNTKSLSSDVIVGMIYSRDKKLWIGTYFGGLNQFDGNEFKHYRHNPSDPQSLGDESVWEILEDINGDFWIGTLRSGLDVFDPKRATFRHYRNGDVNSIHTNYVAALMEDSKGNIWVGTGFGVDVYERETGRFIHYINDPKDPQSLSNNSVLFILEDSRHLVWVATQEGLNQYDPATKKFTALREEDGLSHNTILTIAEDHEGMLWLGTSNGISNLIISKKETGGGYSFSFKNYDESDGLQGKQFNDNAVAKTSKGEIIFGGGNGFTIFKPSEIKTNTIKPRVVLSDFYLFNKSLKTGEKVDDRVLLPRSIYSSEAIELRHNQNIFSIEFAALNFIHPEKAQYKYKLENFNTDWLTTDGTSRRATYTNLDPGEYVFKVKAANSDGLWNEEEVSLKITILPPFWKTSTAFVLYFFFVLGVLYVIRRLIQQRERTKFAIERERQEAQRMHDMDLMKIRFFTNISHEFRTPLSLVLTPLEKIIKNTPNPDQKNQLQLISRNAKRLLNLVNQLLDFRKLEVQEIKFSPSEGDIILFIKETVLSFSDISEKKSIEFTFHTSVDSLETVFDQDKLEKILFNLLSNAFKFTPERGKVSVTVDVVEKAGDVTQWIQIKVTDSGIGIAKEKQEKIFERFFQADLPNSVINQGTGIGLSIAKEFVRAHGGFIDVDSELNQGSTFTVLLPAREIVSGTTPIEQGDTAISNSSLSSPAVEPHAGWEPADQSKKPVLLLVEDNEDFRFYLKDNMKQSYQVMEAHNGAEGLKMAQEYVPDLIVSDVMMPVMDGIEMCKKIRSDHHLSHIPIILLTARMAEEQKMEGFESGADDYITKPFNVEILQSRIKNLLQRRELFQKDFRKQIEVKASDIQITSMDEKLIQKAIRAVEEHIADPDFSVEDLSRELGMSRVYLYKKLVALTGKAPLDFIRTIRLQQAAQLLEKSQLNISEIAYKVGFNNPKYFAKCFKEEYDMLPSAYASWKKK